MTSSRNAPPTPSAVRPLRFAGIADDLTGGIELASILVRGGVAARLLTDRGTTADIGDAAATVIGLKVRVAPRRTAVAAVRRALAVLAPRTPRQIFQKYCATFDSTPRGNIGPIADALMAATGAPFTAFCPAFPEVDRTVYAGHLFAIDQLISRSPKRHDPLTPMREPDLVRVLAAQTAERVGLIRHQVLAAGPAAVEARVAALTAAGVRYAISDTVDEADLACLAEASVDWKLMTGGSSVAVYYPPLWRARSDLEAYAPPAPLPKVSGRAAILAGSCAERTAAQLKAFAETGRPVIPLDAAALADPATADAATHGGTGGGARGDRRRPGRRRHHRRAGRRRRRAGALRRQAHRRGDRAGARPRRRHPRRSRRPPLRRRRRRDLRRRPRRARGPRPRGRPLRGARPVALGDHRRRAGVAPPEVRQARPRRHVRAGAVGRLRRRRAGHPRASSGCGRLRTRVIAVTAGGRRRTYC
jgi:uncharacterized protein YgbK (DUF1537 family)